MTQLPVAKWTRASHTNSGNKEKLEVHARLKRNSKAGSDHLGLPKKQKQVSLDDKEISSPMAAAGSQPCQQL